MKIIVCLETMPDPDCTIMANGDFNFEHCNIRLDSYSSTALEYALQLKDTYGIEVHSYLLDSFELKSVYDEVKSVGSDYVEWIQVPFTFDPFKRAEIFSEAISYESDDIIIAGYHCESCCTNSIPMLIALNKSLPYFPEISSIDVQENSIHLSEFKTGRDITIKKNAVVISIHGSRKLRYPSFTERLACRETDVKPQFKGGSDDTQLRYVSLRGRFQPDALQGETDEKVKELISLMDGRGMFQL